MTVLVTSIIITVIICLTAIIINASNKGNSLKRIKFKIFKVFEAEAELVDIKEKEKTDVPASVFSKELK